VAEVPRAKDALDKLVYDEHNRLQFKPDKTLHVGNDKALVRMFHLGHFFPLPVGIHIIDDGLAKQLLYKPDFFTVPPDSPARDLPNDIGFAGFRVMEPGSERDWLAFLGAAYMRSSGELDQFGMSARALAIDVAMPTPEEFPRFTDFYFAPSETGGALMLYCKLNSPRVAGALAMDISKNGAVEMDTKARYFARESIGRFGIAALTSMFWYSETTGARGADWRPEVHDSDGLAMLTGHGDRLWRPLNNPERVMTSSFSDNAPKGYGLLQRDRNFENYEDDGVFYERRPSVWVEPLGDWGPGQVQLVEIPTDDEIHDNIAAYWLSAKPVNKGDAIAVDYKLTWAKDEPPTLLGRTIATRIGRGGIPGQPRPAGVFKIVVDFRGPMITALGKGAKGVEAMVSASSGTVSNATAYSNKAEDSWRAIFDFTAAGPDPVEMRLFLSKDEVPVTETWLYQFLPVKKPV
jgi:glucans biosynthesis protein